MPLTTTAFPRQLSDANSDGTLLGQSTKDLIGFYGTANPIAQPNYVLTGSQANGQYASSQAGSITKYQVSVVTNSVAATTTVEQTSNVGGSTSNVWTGPAATTSVVFACPPASTAGLGIAGIRVSAAGTVALTYANVSNAAINIATGNYDIIEFKAGALTTSAALTPAAIPANTSVEQIFNITGSVCVPGTVGIVNKPTAQAGIGYNPQCRVIAPNQVGITFFCVTSGAVTSATPTANETYNFAFVPQLNAFNPTYFYTVPAGQAATNASSVTVETSSVTGLLTTDAVVGIQRATSATLTSTGIVGGFVSSAGVLCIEYLTVLGAQTPVSSETYGLTINRLVPLNPAMLYSTTLAVTSCAATSVTEVTSTVTGINASTSIALTKPSITAGLTVVGARVSAANTVAVQYMNLTTTAISVPAETYTIANVQLQGPGVGVVSSGATAGAGLSVTQSFYPAMQQSAQMAQSLRSALVNLGLIAGV